MWNNLWTLYSVTLDTKTAPMAVDIKKMTRLGFSSRYKKSIGFVSWVGIKMKKEKNADNLSVSLGVVVADFKCLFSFSTIVEK